MGGILDLRTGRDGAVQLEALGSVEERIEHSLSDYFYSW